MILFLEYPENGQKSAIFRENKDQKEKVKDKIYRIIYFVADSFTATTGRTTERESEESKRLHTGAKTGFLRSCVINAGVF